MKSDCRFVWHDLGCQDVEGARRFYGELFGWSFDQSGNEPYHHVQAGGRMIGGIRRKEADEHGPPSWLGYVLVEDVPAAVARAKASGGRVYLPTTTMPDVGTFAIVADPTGGVVAPWRSTRPGENEEESAPPGEHTFCWDELLTSDPAVAAGFYTSVFGWEAETRDEGEAGDHTLFIRPGVKDASRDDGLARAAGLRKAPPSVPYPFWLAYVRVEDTDGAAERARGLGARVTVPPTDVPGFGRFCVLQDPEGASLAVVSLPRA